LNPFASVPEPSKLKLSIHDSIHLIHRDDWEAVASDAVPYLRYDHLCALEDAMTDRMAFRYAVFHDPQFRPVGVACFQVLDLEDNGSTYADAVRTLGTVIGSRIVRELKVCSLVCGNAFHYGPHGAHFVAGIDAARRMHALESAMEQLRADERLDPKVAILLFKDLGPEEHAEAHELEGLGYHPLAMDPNMELAIDPRWKDMEGYRSALNAKARTRLRSIMTHSAAVGIKDLAVEEIRDAVPALQQLFDNVLARTPFLFGRLNMAVYAAWKAQLGDDLLFRGLFLNDRLVGFNAAFVVGDALDAQFVGIDYTHNRQHMLYQRMLVDLLETALGRGLGKIRMGRMAEQAKSSLGALPVDSWFHVKHRNRVANRIVGPFIRKVKPGAFELRSPFKG
jgi:hypothetical protein